ncbi:hypothetical protein [Thermocoleostomius sinensis]|uniref:Uncharacterized protein n=1 Tax=Thermocoleostomius sinensis A174 TaxID=2016057 RepID=A0A9E8Z994_9CYAN|nr:hypothetical protein [Thermocoleostomius sinensis]WAL58870.1 hypothetical protein OXH18_17040 [Thermocoleostomius sinensis A174]
MQRIKSFLGWSFATFFGMAFLGSLLSDSPVGTLVLLLWLLICLPPINRFVQSQGLRHWIWWKVGIFAIGFFLIGSTTEPEAPPAAIVPPPVISSPVASESPPPNRPSAEPSPSPIVSPSPTPSAEPSPSPIPAPAPAPVVIPSPSSTPVSTGPIREAVSGSCDCPYDTDRAGRRCGGRSAYSRPGGNQPVCYFEDR